MTSSFGKQVLNSVHDRSVFQRRVRVLGEKLAALFPEGGSVLDIGCGDGTIDVGIMAFRPDLAITGTDIMLRPVTHIPVVEYDGAHLPADDKSVDYALIVDVLHHTEDPAAVLTEAARVARKGVIVKDHLREGLLAGPTLRFMDWVGNYGHNVVLPYNYLSEAEWQAAFARAGLTVAAWNESVGLYPFPASLAFDRRLHFVARLAV